MSSRSGFIKSVAYTVSLIMTLGGLVFSAVAVQAQGAEPAKITLERHASGGTRPTRFW